MAVIHVPPKACSRCANSEVLAIVPSTETTREPREREPPRRLELAFPFLRPVERTNRSGGVSPPGRSGLRRLDVLRPVI